MDFSQIGGIESKPDNERVYTNSVENNKLGKDEFMALLLKQLSYQDPLNPMDSKEFTAQLTQFTSLEELNNINETLNNVLDFQHSMQNATVTNMIGKEVVVNGDAVYKDGTGSELNYELPEGSFTGKIFIYDNAGILVNTLDLGAQSAGSHKLQWNGLDVNGNALPDGVYKFRIDAFDKKGELLDSVTRSSGLVTGVSFRDGLTYLVLKGDREITLGEIEKIQGGTQI